MMMFRTVLAGALALAIVGGVQAQPTQAPPGSPQPEPPAGVPPPGAAPEVMQPPPGGSMQPPQPLSGNGTGFPRTSEYTESSRDQRCASGVS
jgi:hypothetical protein